MGEAHLQDESKKIHGDKLAAAFRKRDDDVEKLPRHPAAKSRADEASRDGIGSAAGRS